MLFQVSLCQEIHSSVALNSTRFRQELNRHNYVTPTSYLELLAIFTNLVGLKKRELDTARNRTKTGLDKVLSCMVYLLTPTVAIWVYTAIRHPVPDRVKPAVICNF